MPEAVDILERQVKDLERKNEALVSDNGKQRDELREARDSIKNLESERDTFKAQVPADGSVTLSKADAIRWQTFSALGTVDEVKAKLERVDTLETADAKRTREDGVKALGYKPSVFEVIAQGQPYTVKGEGDDRKVMLTVDDNEVELGEHAKAQGLEDLLGVMGLEKSAPAQKTAVPTGAGNRPQQQRPVLDSNASYEEKRNDPAYRG